MNSCNANECGVLIFDDNAELIEKMTKDLHAENPRMRIFSTTSPAIVFSTILGGFSKQRQRFFRNRVVITNDTPQGVYLLREIRKKYANIHTVMISKIATAEQIQTFLDEHLICHFVTEQNWKSLSEKVAKWFLDRSAETNIPIGCGWHSYKELIQDWIWSLPNGTKTQIVNFSGKIVEVREALTDAAFFKQLFLNSSYCR